MSSTRRAFTLIELLVAGMITAFLVGAVSMSLSQLSNAKSGSKRRLEAYLRADAALSALRQDVATVLRRSDLFFTRLTITDSFVNTPLGQMDRDELLVFNMQLRPTRDIDYIGEGLEFETQYRIEEDDFGPVLWRRRDAVPDEYELGGGVAVPLAAGVVAVSLEAYDGQLWYQDWDSDYDGIPLAVRVTVTASGHRDNEDPLDAPLATLRTVVPLDRVPLPSDLVEPEEELPADEQAAPEGDDATKGDLMDESGGVPSVPGFGSPGGGPSDGGGRGRRGAPRRTPSGGEPSTGTSRGGT